MKALFAAVMVMVFIAPVSAMTGDIVLSGDVPAGVAVRDGLILGVRRSSTPLNWEDAEVFAAGYEGGGWRLPDISELREIYANREAINEALRKVHMVNSEAMSGLSNNWYWSSTPSETRENYGWFIHFYNGYSADCPKDFDNLHAIVVRNF